MESMARAQHFLRRIRARGSSAVVTTGAAAWSHIYKIVLNKKPQDIKPCELTELETYLWLCADATEKAEFLKLKAEVDNHVGKKLPRGGSARLARPKDQTWWTTRPAETNL